MDESGSGERAPDEHEPRREQIAAMLASLSTDWEQRADETERFRQVVRALRGVSLEEKLRIAGFTLHPVEHNDIEQSCETCMYYLVHRRWCELPEIDLPVRAEWSCNVWRI